MASHGSTDLGKFANAGEWRDNMRLSHGANHVWGDLKKRLGCRKDKQTVIIGHHKSKFEEGYGYENFESPKYKMLKMDGSYEPVGVVLFCGKTAAKAKNSDAVPPEASET
ncbi:hypothetical protein PG993_006854 [Apiospora rasikravindrae]|uniref:Uncharacterized protein n=1 Tax=Apiospora rasikravindrae TaxID=990691 RepID=A0ABR1SVU8_9PEZI